MIENLMKRMQEAMKEGNEAVAKLIDSFTPEEAKAWNSVEEFMHCVVGTQVRNMMSAAVNASNGNVKGATFLFAQGKSLDIEPELFSSFMIAIQVPIKVVLAAARNHVNSELVKKLKEAPTAPSDEPRTSEPGDLKSFLHQLIDEHL